MKIAVTSSDGIKVNQHFGKAETIFVCELAEGEVKLVEKRDIESYCNKNKAIKVEHEFDNYRFNKVFDAIKDCEFLYTQQIGEVPYNKLKESGINVQICQCAIESILNCNGKCK
ncbi:MAG: hypothetical protein MI922_25585 [Bacteroidales bacterium]|nr:hypothetical protein [Bacteroidales bacterium]